MATLPSTLWAEPVGHNLISPTIGRVGLYRSYSPWPASSWPTGVAPTRVPFTITITARVADIILYLRWLSVSESGRVIHIQRRCCWDYYVSSKLNRRDSLSTELSCSPDFRIRRVYVSIHQHVIGINMSYTDQILSSMHLQLSTCTRYRERWIILRVSRRRLRCPSPLARETGQAHDPLMESLHTSQLCTVGTHDLRGCWYHSISTLWLHLLTAYVRLLLLISQPHVSLTDYYYQLISAVAAFIDTIYSIVEVYENSVWTTSRAQSRHYQSHLAPLSDHLGV